MNREPVNLSIDIAGIRLKNPIMTASGTFGYGEEYAPYVDLDRLGAIIVKGVSLKPNIGNPPLRIVETTGGMLNAIGLENVGVDHFLKDKLPYLTGITTLIIVNIFGSNIEEYRDVAMKLDGAHGIAGIELNISCPNVREGGMAFGIDPHRSFEVVDIVRRSTRLPLIVKLSPNVTDITEIARSVECAGADALSLINTMTGMAIDVETRTPRLANITGGLSGPAIKPVALRMVWEVGRVVEIPVIGVGGIMTADDALEFIIAGASAIQVGTANFVNPRATMDILSGIEEYLWNHGISDIKSLIGTLNV